MKKEVDDGEKPRVKGENAGSKKPGGRKEGSLPKDEPKSDGSSDSSGKDESNGDVRKSKGKGERSSDAAGERDRLTGAMRFPSVYDKIDRRKEDSSIRGRSQSKEK